MSATHPTYVLQIYKLHCNTTKHYTCITCVGHCCVFICYICITSVRNVSATHVLHLYATYVIYVWDTHTSYMCETCVLQVFYIILQMYILYGNIPKHYKVSLHIFHISMTQCNAHIAHLPMYVNLFYTHFLEFSNL